MTACGYCLPKCYGWHVAPACQMSAILQLVAVATIIALGSMGQSLLHGECKSEVLGKQRVATFAELNSENCASP